MPVRQRQEMEKVLREGLNVATTTDSKVKLAAEAANAADALLVKAGAGIRKICHRIENSAGAARNHESIG